MPTQHHTPTLHLALGDDERQNRNWEIVDDVMRRLARGQIIPEDLLIQGNLEVTGDATISGHVAALGGLSTSHLDAASATITGNLTAATLTATEGLTVLAGPVSLPPGSLAAATLAPGATVHALLSSTAQTAQRPIPVTPGLVAASLDTTGLEATDRPSLLLFQATIQIGVAADASLSGSYTCIIRRGSDATGVNVSSRAFSYTITRAGFVSLPLTMVRVGLPPAADTSRWSVVALLNNAPGTLTLNCTFAQLHLLQLT